MTQYDKGSAKTAKDASPRRHAEISLVKVKATHLMNNKLPPEEILYGQWFVVRGCSHGTRRCRSSNAGINLGVGTANERQSHIATSSFIG